MTPYKYNGQLIVTANNVKEDTGANAQFFVKNHARKLVLNKDFFLVPKKEAGKIVPHCYSQHAIFLTYSGCKKMLYYLANTKKSKMTRTEADQYLSKTFGWTKEPAITIVEESSAANLLDIDKSLAEMSTDNPIVQLIIDKAAEKVADRIVSRLSA